MKAKYFRTMLIAILLSFFAILICMQSPTAIWVEGEAGADSSVFRYMALLMCRGGVMYRDSFDHKGPLIYILNYLGMNISYYHGIWIIEVLFMIATVGGVYKISRMSCGRLFSCLTTFMVMIPIFLYFEGGNFTEEYAMPFMVGGLYIFLDYFLNEKINRFRLVICGLMFACVSMLRVNMIGVWLVFSVAVLIKELRKKEFKKVGSFLIWFLVGCGIICIPIGVYLIKNGAFYDFIQDYILFNFLYEESGQISGIIRSGVTFVSTDIMILSLGIIIYELTKSSKEKYLYVVYIVFILCSIYLTCMAGRAYGHYGMGLIPAFVFPISLLLRYCEENLSKNRMVYFIALFLLVVGKNGIKDAIKMQRENVSTVYSSELQEVISTIRDNSHEEDRIIVYGNHNIVYVLSHRLADSKYSYQIPIAEVNSEIKESFFRDLHDNIPKIVVLQKENNNFPMLEFMEEYSYCLLCENDKYLIFKIN